MLPWWSTSSLPALSRHQLPIACGKTGARAPAASRAHPVALRPVGDVHVLVPDAAAVDVAEAVEDVALREGQERSVHVPVSQVRHAAWLHPAS